MSRRQSVMGAHRILFGHSLSSRLQTHPWTRIGEWLWFLLLLATTPLATGAAQLEVFPDEIELAAGDRAHVEVRLDQESANVTSDNRLTWRTSPGLPVGVKWVDDESSGQGSSDGRRWLVELTAQETPFQGFVRFEVSPSITADVKIRPLRLVAIDEVIHARLEGPVGELQKSQPENLYLVVQNVSAFPVEIRAIRLDSPAFVKLDPPAGFVLNPGTACSTEMRISVKEDVGKPAPRPGRHLLICHLTLAWQESGRKRQGSVVLAHEVTYSIFGVSQILGVFGIPSFFLLPGFFIVLGFAFGWKHFGSWIWENDDAPSSPMPEPEISNPKTWIVVVSLSAFWAWAYPIVESGRNYLIGYTLSDMTSIGISSFAVGLALAGASVLYHAFYHFARDKDNPLSTLRKLQRRQANTYLPMARLKGESSKLFVIRKNKSHIWVAPHIAYVGKQGRDRKHLVDLERAYEWKDLARILTTATRNSQTFRVFWKKNKDCHKIEKRSIDDVQELKTTEHFVIKEVPDES